MSYNNSCEHKINEQIIDLIKNQQNFAVANIVASCDNLIIEIEPEHNIKALEFLKEHNDLRYRSLIDLFAIDYLTLDKKNRFAVVYNLLSYKNNHRLTLKTYLSERQEIASAVVVFTNANWFEREAFDMYGINFTNHPDLRRILTDYGFEGFPLRKDFPLTGNYQLRYDPTKQEIVREPVFLNQEFRKFDLASPWYGPNNSNQDIKKS